MWSIGPRRYGRTVVQPDGCQIGRCGLQFLDGREHGDRRRNQAVAVEQRGADHAQQQKQRRGPGPGDGGDGDGPVLDVGVEGGGRCAKSDAGDAPRDARCGC
jgi:hypothetical protein